MTLTRKEKINMVVNISVLITVVALTIYTGWYFTTGHTQDWEEDVIELHAGLNNDDIGKLFKMPVPWVFEPGIGVRYNNCELTSLTNSSMTFMCDMTPWTIYNIPNDPDIRMY